MITSDRAAVASSSDPTTGDPDRILVEAVEGLGVVLADGTVRPDRYRMDRDPRHRPPGLRPPGSSDHGGAQVLEPPQGAARHDMATLSTADLLVIAEHLERAEDHLGVPQDLELAIDGHGELFVVEARSSVPPSPTYPAPYARRRPLVLRQAAGHAAVPAPLLPPDGQRERLASSPPRRGRSAGGAGDPRGARAEPGWLATRQAVAVVTDEGGAMSNLAVMCRERRIPFVGLKLGHHRTAVSSVVTVDGDRVSVA